MILGFEPMPTFVFFCVMFLVLGVVPSMAPFKSVANSAIPCLFKCLLSLNK